MADMPGSTRWTTYLIFLGEVALHISAIMFAHCSPTQTASRSPALPQYDAEKEWQRK
jgi:hypothetical protein